MFDRGFARVIGILLLAAVTIALEFVLRGNPKGVSAVFFWPMFVAVFSVFVAAVSAVYFFVIPKVRAWYRNSDPKNVIRNIFTVLERCIFKLLIFFVVCFAGFTIAMFVLLATVQVFFLFFLGLRIDLLGTIFLNHNFFEMIHAASIGGAILLGTMYWLEQWRMRNTLVATREEREDNAAG